MTGPGSLCGRAALPAALLAVVAGLAPAAPAGAEAPVETALTLSPDAPAGLVLAYWPKEGWVVRQSGRQVELALLGARLAIAADSVRLPAGDGAIETITAETGPAATYLRLGLGCDCTLAVHGDGTRLHIDVVGAVRIAGPVYRDPAPAPRLAPVPPPVPPFRNGPGAAAAAAAGPAELQAQRIAETRTRLLNELRRAAEAGLVTLRPGAEAELPQDDGPAVADTAADTVADPVADPVVEAKADTMADTGADTMADGADIEAAVAAVEPQGAGPKPSLEDHAAARTEAHPGASVAHAAETEPASDVATDPPGRPAAPGALPRPAPVSEAGRPVEQAGLSPDDLVATAPAGACFGNAAFLLPEPLPPAALTAEIGRLRRVLVGEFDRPDVPAALALARLYLAQGMADEALGTLADFAPAAPETPLLAALAWLSKGRSLPEPNVLAVPGCSGQHALWQAMDAALAGQARAALDHEAAATGALEQAPRGLRGQIATRLGHVAMDAGDLVTAYRLNAMAKRAVPQDDPEFAELRELLAARIALGRGETGEAARQLARLSRGRSPAGAQALLLLAELAADPAQAIPVRSETLRLDLGVLAMTERDTPLGERAFLAEAEMTGRAFGRDAALDLLKYGRAGRVIGEDAYRNALAVVGATLPETPADTPLAVLYESDPGRFARSLEDRGFRHALSESYVRLGAPALGEAALRAGDLQDPARRGRLAGAYLDVGDPAAARRVAAALPEGPERMAVEAGVALAEGSFAVASQRLAATGAPLAARARVAWAAGDWPLAEAVLAELAMAAGAADAAGEPREQSGAEPAMRLSARLALAARRSGREAPPAEALSLVAAGPQQGRAAGPDPAAGLAALFAPAAVALDDPTPAGLTPHLDGVSAEAQLFEELLNDG